MTNLTKFNVIRTACIILVLFALYLSTGCIGDGDDAPVVPADYYNGTVVLSDNFDYKDNGDSITIIKYKASGAGSVVIPGVINGRPVKSIGDNAFFNCAGLTGVSIPDSVTAIGWYAFAGCTGLTGILIPDSVTVIGANAFSGCTGLTGISIPAGVAEIENNTFYGCTGLTDVIIPNGVTSIEDNTFYGCTGLKSVTIADSVTSIDDNAFYGCISLAGVSIPAGVTSIGDSAFRSTGLIAVSIPANVTAIDSNAFYRCGSLSSVYFYGNAPAEFKFGVFDDCAQDFKIYYIDGRTGWTVPTWNSYPTSQFVPGSYGIGGL